MKQEIPWNRFVVEAIVIVGSILLALAIDAWWAERIEMSYAFVYPIIAFACWVPNAIVAEWMVRRT